MTTTNDPIVLVGMQRSGTTWMGRVLGEHPGITYWPEPRQIWSFGNWWKPDDRLTADDARPWVRRHIRHTFARYADEHGGGRFCEKTPSNCLRVPFIRAVYPEARILMIVRDGRSVIRSTAQMREGGRVDWGRIKARIRETRLVDLPSFLDRVPGLINPILGRPQRFWGVRPPGWRAWMKSDPPYVVMAKQWASSIRYAVEDGRALPDRYLEIRYEDLMARPTEVMQRVVDFLELAGGADLVRKVSADVDPSRQRKWRDQLGADVLEEVRPHIEPTLNWLGYEWD